MTLPVLLAMVGPLEEAGLEDVEVVRVWSDSRTTQKGDLFVSMPSENPNLLEYARAARANGAVGILTSNKDHFKALKKERLPVALLESGLEYHAALAIICANAYENPTTEFDVIGITGTNGKTTTAWMLKQALENMGSRVAYIGTLGFAIDERRDLPNTTPYPVELWNLFLEAREEGCDYVVMEVSSHSLAEARVAYVPFTLSVFTNLTQDHLDFHASMKEYEAAKLKLFTDYALVTGEDYWAVVNVDDETGQRWLPELEDMTERMREFDQVLASELKDTLQEYVPEMNEEINALTDQLNDYERQYYLLSYGFAGGDVQGRLVHVDVDRLELEFTFAGETGTAVISAGGTFNGSNALAVVATLLTLEGSVERAAEAMQGVTGAPGRFESVPNDRGIGVIVDYAHTPDALEKLLQSARELEPRRLITVFGCGGDRDKSKRPQMAKVVSSLSDACVITSDNPRTEDPLAIIEDIQSGIVPGTKFETIVDRRAAIERGVSMAERGDIVVIAGKGHEDYQIIGKEKVHMDDREMAAEALA